MLCPQAGGCATGVALLPLRASHGCSCKADSSRHNAAMLQGWPSQAQCSHAAGLTQSGMCNAARPRSRSRVITMASCRLSHPCRLSQPSLHTLPSAPSLQTTPSHFPDSAIGSITMLLSPAFVPCSPSPSLPPFRQDAAQPQP